jgi:hypothetical protein
LNHFKANNLCLRKGLFPEKRLNYDPRTEFERGKKKPSHFGLYILAPILADALYLKLTRGPFMQGASGPICFKKKKKKKKNLPEEKSLQQWSRYWTLDRAS